VSEKSLHAALKQWYALPDDKLEVPLDSYIIDIVRGDLLIEIQTRNFSAIKRKLLALTERYPVRLVYPIAREKWIIKFPGGGQRKSTRRKSPKRGKVEEVFGELVSIPALIADDNFSLEVLLIQEEESRRHDARRGWRRRGWVTHERRLLDVVGRQIFQTPADLAGLLPSTLTDPFTTADLAEAISQRRRLAQRMAYCLREMSVITQVGRSGRSILYRRRTGVEAAKGE
jgi:hypothetical protein